MRKKGSKYGNQKVKVAGVSFHSKLEAAVHQILTLREAAGEIRILQLQDHVYLTEARVPYIADFKCEDIRTGYTFWVEAKGYESERWPTVKKLWKVYGPGILEVWKGAHRNPILSETIIPKGALWTRG